MRFASCQLLALLLLSFPLSAQSVWSVDSTGITGNFLDIQDAIDIASNGDLIVVQPGIYQSFVVDDLSLSIAGDGPGVFVLKSLGRFVSGNAVEVRNLSLGKTVNLSDLVISLDAPPVLPANSGHGLLVDNCAGVVHVFDCRVVVYGKSIIGISVVNSPSVSLVNVESDASLTTMNVGMTSEAHALSAVDSNVFSYGCELISGAGAVGEPLAGPPLSDGRRGAAGVRLEGGFFLGVRLTAEGGPGGIGADDAGLGCGDGGRGGAGLELVAGASTPEYFGSRKQLRPGTGGVAGNSFGGTPCFAGSTGVPMYIGAGIFTPEEFEERSHATNNLVRYGQTKVETFVGQPADGVWHVFGAVPLATVPIFPLLGAGGLIGPPSQIRFRGLIPASGQKDLSLPLVDLGIDFVVLYEQAYFFDGFRSYLSNPQASILMDPDF